MYKNEFYEDYKEEQRRKGNRLLALLLLLLLLLASFVLFSGVCVAEPPDDEPEINKTAGGPDPTVTPAATPTPTPTSFYGSGGGSSGGTTSQPTPTATPPTPAPPAKYTVFFEEQYKVRDATINLFSDAGHTTLLFTLATDADGKASKIDLDDGNYWFSASKTLYDDYNGTFTIAGADNTTQFTMSCFVSNGGELKDAITNMTPFFMFDNDIIITGAGITGGYDVNYTARIDLMGKKLRSDSSHGLNFTSDNSILTNGTLHDTDANKLITISSATTFKKIIIEAGVQIEIKDGKTLTIDDNTITIENGAMLTIDGTGTISGGTINGIGNGIIVLNGVSISGTNINCDTQVSDGTAFSDLTITGSAGITIISDTTFSNVTIEENALIDIASAGGKNLTFATPLSTVASGAAFRFGQNSNIIGATSFLDKSVVTRMNNSGWSNTATNSTITFNLSKSLSANQQIAINTSLLGIQWNATNATQFNISTSQSNLEVESFNSLTNITILNATDTIPAETEIIVDFFADIMDTPAEEKDFILTSPDGIKAIQRRFTP